MTTRVAHTKEKQGSSVANGVSLKPKSGGSTFQFVDNRPRAIAQKEMQEMANESPRVRQLAAFQEMANNSPRVQQPTAVLEMAGSPIALQQQLSHAVLQRSVVQRVAYTAPQFRTALHEHVFGEAASFPGLGGFNKNLFITDLMALAAQHDSAEVMRLGRLVYQFVAELDRALTYRSVTTPTVRAMQAVRAAANFGDLTAAGIRIIGGTANPWPSIHSTTLPAGLRNTPRYLPRLHQSVARPGQWDYRPSVGILFHITK